MIYSAKGNTINMVLDDTDTSFDQFQGKRSTYRDEIYTTKIDESKITDELRRKAEKIEKEITN